jgi:hypothetical protein
MKRLALRLCVALATFTFGTAAGKLLPSPFHTSLDGATTAEREVLSVERAYLAAHVRHDDAALDRILADDFQFDHPSGYVEDKARRLALVANPDFAFTSIDTEGVAVNVRGDRATVAGRARVHVLRSQEFPDVSPWYRFVRAYERRAGRWQIVAVRASYLGCR